MVRGMSRLLALFAIAALVVVNACDGGEPVPLPDAGPDELQFLPQLDDVADYDELKGPTPAGTSETVKYLAQVEGVAVTPPINDECVFQNTSLYQFHLFFLNAQPGGEDLGIADYTQRVLRRETRVWWGGDVIFDPELAHPTSGEPGTLLWTLYTEDSAGNRLEIDDVRAGFARLSPCLPAFDGKLAFFPSSQEQTQTTRLIRAQLAGEGIAVFLQ